LGLNAAFSATALDKKFGRSAAHLILHNMARKTDLGSAIKVFEHDSGMNIKSLVARS